MIHKNSNLVKFYNRIRQKDSTNLVKEACLTFARILLFIAFAIRQCCLYSTLQPKSFPINLLIKRISYNLKQLQKAHLELGVGKTAKTQEERRADRSGRWRKPTLHAKQEGK